MKVQFEDLHAELLGVSASLNIISNFVSDAADGGTVPPYSLIGESLWGIVQQIDRINNDMNNLLCSESYAVAYNSILNQ